MALSQAPGQPGGAADRACRRGIEAVLLAVVVGIPWALGGTLPEATLALNVGLGIVLALWAARIVLTGSIPWRGDAALWALGGLTLLAAFQLLPLPTSVLRVLSPNTVETNVRLRPEVGERLPGEDGPDVPRPAAFPLSLSPPDTRDVFAQLFALTLLYAAARSNLAGPGPLRRLAWACAVNGALLCLLGIAQRLSASPSHMVYWSLPTPGAVFGPFVNRNHLPDYVNVCLGLGCALLARHVRGGPAELLQRPVALWLLLLIGVMAVGVVFSQSRGGVVSGVGAAAGCLLVWVRYSRRATGLGWAVWAALVFAAGAAWVGWGPLTARLGNWAGGQLPEEGRFDLWAEGLGIFARYPLFGTGAGTYTWVELGARTKAGNEHIMFEYAHNEYVEALAEGGLPRLALTLLLVVGPVVRLVRRYRRVVGRPEAAVLLGGLFGVLAVALHSFVDFGVHIPAVAVLAVVNLAGLMGAADSSQEPGAVPAPRLALPIAAGLVVAGALIAWDAWVAERAELCRAAGARLIVGPRTTPEQAERAVRLLTAACEARPAHALSRHELGQAYLALALTRPDGSAERTAAMREALGQWRAARDLSPVMAPTHARLGAHRDLFERADPALTYFERARRLFPTDPEMPYFCGRARWQAGDLAGACADWKASLAGSDRYLGDILELARQRIGPDDILRDVMPDRPAVLLKAADALFPKDEAEAPGRRAYLERARDALAAQSPGAKAAADWELEARLEAGLGRPDRAAAAYRRALGLSPRQGEWRVAYAELLRQSGNLKDAARELETVVAQDPNNRPARDQLAVVRREIKLRGRE